MTDRRRPCIALRATIGALLVVAVPVAAQDATSDTVVVTGRKLSEGKQLRRYVRQIASTVDGQLSRFADPVCPLAAGLAPASNQAIQDRIRLVAADAGVKQGRPGCTTNLVLAITHDADAFMAALQKRFPAVFAELPTGDVRRAMADGPVHVWSIVEVRNEDGQRIAGATDDGVKVLNVRSASRINRSTQQAVVQSVVIIDSAAVAGKSLAQIADFAAMRALAGARPPGDAQLADTILTLFDTGATAPPGLIPLDTGFLRGLYRTQPNGRATAEMSVIARTIAKEAKD